MNIYGDLFLRSSSDVIYNDPSVSHNVWRFVGTNRQNINTEVQDLSYVEFIDAGTTYSQQCDDNASEKIRFVLWTYLYH